MINIIVVKNTVGGSEACDLRDHHPLEYTAHDEDTDETKQTYHGNVRHELAHSLRHICVTPIHTAPTPGFIAGLGTQLQCVLYEARILLNCNTQNK